MTTSYAHIKTYIYLSNYCAYGGGSIVVTGDCAVGTTVISFTLVTHPTPSLTGTLRKCSRF